MKPVLNFSLYWFIVYKVWYAIGDVLDKTNEKILHGLYSVHVCTSPYNFMHKVKKVSVTKKTIAVPVDNIKRVCVHIALKYSPIDLVIMQPNEYNTIDQCYFT